MCIRDRFRLRRILTDTNTEWSIEYDQLGFERNTASPLQSIDLKVHQIRSRESLTNENSVE